MSLTRVCDQTSIFIDRKLIDGDFFPGQYLVPKNRTSPFFMFLHRKSFEVEYTSFFGSNAVIKELIIKVVYKSYVECAILLPTHLTQSSFSFSTSLNYDAKRSGGTIEPPSSKKTRTQTPAFQPTRYPSLNIDNLYTSTPKSNSTHSASSNQSPNSIPNVSSIYPNGNFPHPSSRLRLTQTSSPFVTSVDTKQFIRPNEGDFMRGHTNSHMYDIPFQNTSLRQNGSPLVPSELINTGENKSGTRTNLGMTKNESVTTNPEDIVQPNQPNISSVEDPTSNEEINETISNLNDNMDEVTNMMDEALNSSSVIKTSNRSGSLLTASSKVTNTANDQSNEYSQSTSFANPKKEVANSENDVKNKDADSGLNVNSDTVVHTTKKIEPIGLNRISKAIEKMVAEFNVGDYINSAQDRKNAATVYKDLEDNEMINSYMCDMLLKIIGGKYFTSAYIETYQKKNNGELPIESDKGIYGFIQHVNGNHFVYVFKVWNKNNKRAYVLDSLNGSGPDHSGPIQDLVGTAVNYIHGLEQERNNCGFNSVLYHTIVTELVRSKDTYLFIQASDNDIKDLFSTHVPELAQDLRIKLSEKFKDFSDNNPDTSSMSIQSASSNSSSVQSITKGDNEENLEDNSTNTQSLDVEILKKKKNSCEKQLKDLQNSLEINLNAAEGENFDDQDLVSVDEYFKEMQIKMGELKNVLVQLNIKDANKMWAKWDNKYRELDVYFWKILEDRNKKTHKQKNAVTTQRRSKRKRNPESQTMKMDA